MGVVYKARQRALGRLVAVKMVLAGGHAGPDELARFRTEAEAVARLQHPNIVQIHEVGEADGHPYFTLEYCPGGSLASRLDGTPWAPENAAELVGTLARAMQAAHAAGVIHRDLKPANVLLTADSTPKVTDFGLAKKLEEAEGRTESGVIMGTPIYMAPEQAAGRTREVGPAADVYALGAVLYELLTGRPPFKAATPLETIYQVIADEPVPPSRLQTGVPRDAETICLKCLHKEPARRYASAADLADDLARFLRHEPIRARSAGPLYRLGKFTRRHKVLVAALAAVFLALVGGVLGTGAGLVRAREEANRAWAAEVETERRLAAESEARRELSASYHEAARLVVRPRDWRLALTLIDKALVGDPSDSAELHLDKVRAWCALHELPKATEELESLAGRVGGTDLEGRVLLWGAGLALSRHDPDVGAVLGRVRQALDKGLPPAEAAYARALLARTSPEAVEYLKQSLRADPFNPQAHGLLTLLLGLLGRFDEARDNIRSAESLFPQNSLYGVIQAQLLALQDDSRAAGQQLERARPRLSAKQMESARAVVDLSGQLPALARVVEGNILNDPNASPFVAVGRLATSLIRARSALARPGGDLYLPLHPVLWKAFEELPSPLLLVTRKNQSVYDSLGRVAEVHPDGFVHLTQGVLLGNEDTPVRWAAAERAFSRAVETRSVFPIHRAALYAAAGAEWVLSREGSVESRPEMQRRARENMRKLVALGVLPKQAPLLLLIAFQAQDPHTAHYILGQWERQAPEDPDLRPWRIRTAFHSGSYYRAIELIDQVVRADPREAASWKKMRDEAADRLRRQAETVGKGGGTETLKK